MERIGVERRNGFGVASWPTGHCGSRGCSFFHCRELGLGAPRCRVVLRLGMVTFDQGRVAGRVSFTADGVGLVGRWRAALKIEYGGGTMRRLFLGVMIILGLGVAANAQTFRGAINGTVTDPSGAVVPSAHVKATESATGIDHATTTTTDGEFAFQDIPLGFYKVTITAPGFPPYAVDKVEVVAGTILTLPIRLTPHRRTRSVGVSAAGLTLDTTKPAQTTAMTETLV